MNLPVIPSELITAIADGNAVVFVGAGLSQAAGLPGWSQLLRRMIDWAEEQAIEVPERSELEKHIEKGKLLFVAQVMRKKLGDNRFCTFMREVFDPPGLQPTPVQRLLPRLPFAACITTNYDKLLESAYTDSKKIVPRVVTHINVPELALLPGGKEFYILKMHGTIDACDTLVLGRPDYRKIVFETPALNNVLRNIFATKTVFFIGFSLNDYDIDFLLEELRSNFRGYQRNHFALMNVEEVDDLQKQQFAEDGVQVLRYQPSSQNHPEVFEFLSMLLNKVEEYKSHKPIHKNVPVPRTIDLLERFREIHGTQLQSIGEIKPAQINFADYIYDGQVGSWDELISNYTSEHWFERQTFRNAFVQCLPLGNFGQVLGLRLVADLLKGRDGTPAIFISIESTQPIRDLSVLLVDTGIQPHEINEPCVAIVQLKGIRELDEILNLIPQMSGGANWRNNVRLIIIGNTGSENLPILSSLGRCRIFETKTPVIRISDYPYSIPFELAGEHYPMHSLAERPEAMFWYRVAESLAKQQLGLSSIYSNIDRWKVTIRAIRNFVCDNLRLISQEEQRRTLKALSEAWISRHLLGIGVGKEESNLFLKQTGLFVLGDSETNAHLQPIAGAISAYLDGYFLSIASENEEHRLQVVLDLLNHARSPRRLPKKPTSQETTSWLALMISAYLGSQAFTDWLIDVVAKVDLSIALDLSAITASLAKERKNLIEDLFNFTYSHRCGMRMLFEYKKLESANRVPVNPDPGGEPRYEEARKILTEIPDPDLLALLLASCAVPTGKSILAPELWDAVVPTRITDALNRLGREMRNKAPSLHKNVRFSERVLLSKQLEQAFPHVHRFHSSRDMHEDFVIQLPWLTAYVVAHGCGGRLPTITELREGFTHPAIQESTLDRTDVTKSDYWPHTRQEWVAPVDTVMGDEFRGPTPTFFDRIVTRTTIKRSVSTGKADLVTLIDGVMSISDEDNILAKPSTSGLAATRIVFEPGGSLSKTSKGG